MCFVVCALCVHGGGWLNRSLDTLTDQPIPPLYPVHLSPCKLGLSSYMCTVPYLYTTNLICIGLSVVGGVVGGVMGVIVGRITGGVAGAVVGGVMGGEVLFVYTCPEQ